MSINGIGSASSLMVQSVVDMRARLADLQRQLGTGKKSETYAGVGLDRGLAVGLRTKLSAVDSYTDTIKTLNMRIDLAQTALTRVDDLSKTVRSAARLTGYELDDTGQTTAQKNARLQLDEVLGLLNTQAGDRYLFSGRAGDRPAVDTVNNILDGDGVRAGFKQIVAERNLADLGGFGGLGRVAPAAAGNVFTLSEDVAGSAFGFKLGAVTSTLANAAVTGPGGSPPSVSVDFTAGNPNPGDKITFTLNLPDGSHENLVLTATTSATPGPNEFTIGATPALTAGNLQAAATASLGKLASTSLSAASALAAANDFFNIDDANPPRRVSGPPATATTLVSGTPADTVFWYTGEGGSDPARGTAVARVDDALTVPYGLRANEQAPRNAVQNIAAFAAMTFSPTDPDGEERYQALTSRVGDNLSDAPGKQQIADIEADLATAQATLDAANDRHAQNKNVLAGLVEGIEGVPIEEIGAKVLVMNTRLQASLQTTSMLFQTSLINYLK